MEYDYVEYSTTNVIMKRVIIATCLVLTFLTGVAQSSESEAGIKFETGVWKDILTKAKSENKYVFLDAFTTWCGPCKLMDQHVYPKTEVGEFFNKNFVNAKIDMEKGEGLELAKLYKVKAYPSYLFVDGNGELVHRAVGFMQAPAFIKMSSNALDPEKQYVSLMKRFDNGETNQEFVYKLAYVARDAYDMLKAQELAAVYLKSQNNLLEEKNVKFIGDFTTKSSDPNFEFMRKNASVFEASIGKERYQRQMYNMVYQGSFEKVGFKKDSPREEASQFVKAASEYFIKTLPEQAPKLTHSFAMDVFQTTKEWDGYAKEAIGYYDKNPSIDWNELNDVAWGFYENVTNKEHLQKAVEWGLASVELNENYFNTDTVASLYFKLGDKAKAKEYAKRAIALGKEKGQDTTSTEKLLNDISLL